MSEHEYANHHPSVATALGQLVVRLDILKSVRAPNKPIPNFEFPEREFFDEWKHRLKNVPQQDFIGDLKTFLSLMIVPRLGEKDAEQEHVTIQGHIVEARLLAEDAITSAMSSGYPFESPVLINPAAFMHQIKEMHEDLEQMRQIVKQLASPLERILSGISLPIGPLSVSLGALKTAIQISSDAISKIEIDMRMLSRALVNTAKVANATARLAADSAQFISAEGVEALREVARRAVDLAGKGLNLLREALRLAEANEARRSETARKRNASRPARVLSRDLAIDLGTANTVVYVSGKSIVLNEPSVVAVTNEGHKKHLLAAGSEAKAMLGRTHGDIDALQPIRDGGIIDYDGAVLMLKYFIRKLGDLRSYANPRIVVSVHPRTTGQERRCIEEAVASAGARRVYFIESPLAAAIGARLPVLEPAGSMMVNIGAGTTDVGIFTLGGTEFSSSIRVGGSKMDEAIIAYARRSKGLLISEARAETLKKEIGSAAPPADGPGVTTEVKGQGLLEGRPMACTVTQREIAEAIAEPVAAIVESVKYALEMTPPHLAADIVGTGIILTGGGSLLANLDQVLREETGLPISIADDPLSCVALGAGHVLENIRSMWHLLSSIP